MCVAYVLMGICGVWTLFHRHSTICPRNSVQFSWYTHYILTNMYVAVQTVTVEDKTSAVVVWGAHAAGDNRATWNHDAVFAGIHFVRL